MKFHLATAHGTFGSFESAGTAHRGTGLNEQFGHKIWSAIQHLGQRLASALRPPDLDEAYLAQAQNHADLERRIQDLINPDRDRLYWRY